MTQRFTVEMERMDILRTTIEVVARDIAHATTQAQRTARTNPNIWVVDRGPLLVKKITAHANRRGAL